MSGVCPNPSSSLSLTKIGARMLSFKFVTICSSDPNPWWVLLLYVHVVILARAIPAPQTTATVLTGSSKDPCSSWSPAVPAERYPALDVTWPKEEVPLSKQVSWEPNKIEWPQAGCEHRVRGLGELVSVPPNC